MKNESSSSSSSKLGFPSMKKEIDYGRILYPQEYVYHSIPSPTSSASKFVPTMEEEINYRQRRCYYSASLTNRSKFVPTMDEVFEWHEPEPELDPVSKIHDVFLSFRGEDTRATFTSHLYTALQNAGIKVFIDDHDLQRGDHISPSLSLAIQQSQIAIIVFSINYADSRWCMDELVKIMGCHRTLGQLVVPVFYHIDPSEVRRQRGQFGEGFQRLLKKIMNEMEFFQAWKLVISWRAALFEAANIAGFVILNSRNESDDIKRIVNKVSHLLNKTDLFVAHNPVGVESRVQEVIQLLQPDLQTKKVQLLGIWGMGGIGKTTIAKAIYNKIGCQFEGRSFIANIREHNEKSAELVGLQEQLLFDIFKGTTMKIPNIESGMNTLQCKLSKKKVLILLDDVNTLEQLNTFCGSSQWFGPGSIIIITTRDMNLLGGRVDKLYKMTIMNENESIELFCWNAFKQVTPREDFANISKNIVEYSGGLPLALEVLGSNLFNKKLLEWGFVLEKLKRIPNCQVHKKLRISYDDLNDDDVKEIFLDIACFCIGMDRNDVILVLNDCGLSAEIGIRVLVDRSLVTIDDKNMIGMHDLLRDMGREIIREESPRVPEKQSRLWFPKDVIEILSRQTGKKSVMGLALKLSRENAKCFSTKAFQKMKRLYLLQLAEVKLDGDFEHVSRNLRWLLWDGLSHIPTNFFRENLVSIELKNCNAELQWNKTLMMEKLKILNLSHSHHLTQSPDFSNMPNLEKLILKDCPLLSEIEKLEDVEQMESSTKVPFSVIGSKSIGYISLWNYERFSCDVFSSIIWSWVSPTYSLPSQFQTSTIMSSLDSSQELSTFSNYLPRLRSLWVDFKSEDQLALHAKIILDALYVTVSKDLESTATTSQLSSSSQVHVLGSIHCLKSLLVQMGMNCQVTNFLKEKILQNMDVNESDGCFLPGDNYPNWITFFGSETSSVTFQVPQVEERNLNTMMCVVYTSTPDDIASDGHLKSVLVKNYTKSTIQLYKRETLASLEDEEGRRIVLSMEPGNKVEVVFVFEDGFIVKKIAVYLVYDELVGEKLELHHVPDLRGIVCRDDENEATEEDFNLNRKKKSRVK
ncbi:unnamed protein product [Lathyrus sativus]|nr:unnamed protein product [Lathyrus sativus]